MKSSVAAIAIALVASAARIAAAPLPAVHLESGGVARQALVAVGRDVVVDGHAESDVVALEGSATIAGTVEGDVIALGGDVRLAPTAAVHGDVFALGGVIEAAAGCEIDGRSVAYPTFSRAGLTLLEGPSLGLGSMSSLVVGAKLALAAAWLLLALLLFASDGRAVEATSREIVDAPGRCFVIGLAGLATAVLTSLFLAALLPGLASVPILVLVTLGLLLLKLWGMVAVFHAVGEALVGRIARRRWLGLHAALAGLLVLAALKFLPYVGLVVWTVATLLGVGATLATKFGRREAWFASGSDPLLAPRR